MLVTAVFEDNRDAKVHFSEYLITSFNDGGENNPDLQKPDKPADK